MRILYQSFVDPEAHAAYVNRLRAYLGEAAGPGVEVEVGGISPPDVHLSRLTELRCAVQAVANALAAEQEGFDAFVIGHFQDGGLVEARSALDIPVVGMGEATMHLAAQLGRTLGLVTIDPVFASWHLEQAERYGLAARVVGVVAATTPVADLVAAFEDEGAYRRVLDRFVEEARPLVEAGAETIVPAGGLFGLLAAGEHRFRVDEAAVVNPVLASLKQAELLAAMQALNGTEASRAGTYAKPPREAVEEFLAAARRPE